MGLKLGQFDVFDRSGCCFSDHPDQVLVGYLIEGIKGRWASDEAQAYDGAVPDISGLGWINGKGLKALPDSESLLYLSLVASFDLAHPMVCDDAVPAAIQRYPQSTRMLILRARCEVSAGRDDDALATIGTAVELGFKQLELLGTAQPFEGLAQTPAFKEMLARVAAEDASGELPTSPSTD